MDTTHEGPHGPAAVAAIDRDELTRARLAAIVTSCPDPIIGETLDGIITDWNPAAERLYGYSAAEAIGQPLSIIVPPDRDAEVAELFARVRRGKSVAGFETVRRTKDGRRIAVSLTIFPVTNDRGELIGASSTTRDISERKAAEVALSAARQELRASEARYRTLVEQLPGVVYLLAADEEETPLYYSQYLNVMMGISPDVALRREDRQHWLAYVHPEDRERIAELNRSTVEDGFPFSAEYRHQRADGDYVWVRDVSTPIYDDDGALVAWQGILLDISDRIAAEAVQARLAAIVEGAEDAIISRTLDGTITSWNRGAEHLYGFTAEEMIGQSLARILPGGESLAVLYQPEDFGEQPTRYEATRRRADGSRIEVAISLSPIRDRGGAIVGISSITRDITERKRAEEELRVALAEARATTAAKSRFLSMLSHELRTPLQAVLGYADFLLASPTDSLSDEQREDIGFIYKGATRMVALIEQMLDLSRMEAGRLDLAIEEVDLGAIIEQVRQDVAPQAEARGLALEIALAPDLPVVRADARCLRQTLLNLAGNAVKFTEHGTIRISAQPAAGGGVDIAVSDTGIGIPPEALEQIFDEFHQVDSAQTRHHGGAGLGLAIARGLAEQMGGQIHVTSQPGQGSTFTLRME